MYQSRVKIEEKKLQISCNNVFFFFEKPMEGAFSLINSFIHRPLTLY